MALILWFKHIAMDITDFKEQYRSPVIELWRDCNLIVPWNDPDKDIDRKLKVDPELFLIGIEGGKLVATVMGGYEGHRGWINYLAVSPAHRYKGYGRQLVMAVEERIGALGCPKINLQVRASNPAAIAFYKALGYGIDDVIGLGKRLESDE